MHNVFVYGTLLKGERNDFLLKNATCIAEHCTTLGELYDTGYGYPAIKLSNEARVYGELYQVSDDELIELDRLEGYTDGAENNLYERVIHSVETETGTTTAFVYVAASENLLNERIVSGNWRVK